MFQKLTNFQQRCFFGTIGVVLITAIIACSHTATLGYIFMLLLAAVQAIALWEYYLLAESQGAVPMKGIGIGFGIGYIFLRYATTLSPHLSFLNDALFCIFVLTAFFSHFFSTKGAIANLAITTFGVLYITLPLSFLIDINYVVKWPYDHASSVWIVYLLIATKATDTCAYFAGKKWGKRPLAANLSPQKTIEGAQGGLVGAVVATFLFFIAARAFGYLKTSQITLLELFFLGCAMGIAAQLGDLAESLLKRDAGTKDSSSLPGFGGVLDVIDSLIFTTPLLYLWLQAKSVL